MLSEEKTQNSLDIVSGIQPHHELVFQFTDDPEDILDVFQSTASSISFELIQRQSSYATAVKRIEKKSGLMSLVNCCSWFQSDAFSAIKIILSRQSRKNALKDTYIAEVKGLVGISAELTSFMNSFENKLTKLGVSMNTSNVMLAQSEQFSLDFTQNENPFYLEACSHHIVNKLIQNSQYEICSSMMKMLTDFKNTFRNVQESAGLIPLPVKNAISIVTDVSQQLEILLVKLKYAKEIQPFARIAVQNYVFSQVQNIICSIYRFKNIKNQQLFQQKRNKILQSYTIRQILKEVCLSQKYWSVNTSTLDSLLPPKKAKQQIYFNIVCRSFQKLVFTTSPRQKIKYCQLAYTQLKNHFYDFSRGKYELASMEDIIPVLIAVVLFLQIGQLRSELDIMIDFINSDPTEMEAQKRLLINLSVLQKYTQESYNYINRDWVLKQ